MEQSKQFVEYAEFIAVISGVVSLTLGGFWILISKLMGVKERVAKTESQNDSDIKNIDGLWEKVNAMNDQRSKDVVQFTEVIGKLNTTLGKMEITLENTNAVIEKMDKRLDSQDKEIDRLKNGGNRKD